MASPQIEQLKYLFGVSGVMSMYGIASMAVWFLGPSVGLGSTERIVLIALVLLTLPIGLVASAARKRRKEAAADEPAAAPEAAPAKAGRGKIKAVKSNATGPLDEGAEEAVRWLRGTKLAGARDADAVYRLPWFVVAGPPGAGKTSLALTSTLDFHALPSQRNADANRLRPTAGCEWRIADDAVVVDTSGAYFAEDGGWAACADMLTKVRKQRPLDGLVLTVSAERLLGSSRAENETYARLLRERLDELAHRTGGKYPVYLVFTHADAIDGFAEFFSATANEDGSEVWGATFPLESAHEAHALFDVEMEYLQESLVRRRLVRLARAADAGEQLRVFEFPTRFADARKALAAFSSSLFRPNPFRESPFVRGFYFTSSATASPDARPWSVDLPAGGRFVEGFVRGVLLPDRDLASALAGTARHRVRDVLLSCAAAAIAIFAVGMVVSFVANRRVLADARERAAAVKRIVRPEVATDMTKKELVAATDELDALDGLRRTITTVEEPPLYRRFGLNVGNRVDEPLLLVYNDAVYPRFARPAAERIQKDLRAFADAPVQPAGGADSLDDLNHYDLLRAYLMVSDRSDKADANFLDAELAPYWTGLTPDDLRARDLATAQLDFYAARVASRPDMQRAVADAETVKAARAKLATYSVEAIFLKRVTAEIGDKVAPVTLESVGGRSGGWISGDYAVPGGFTLDGYREMTERLKTVGDDIQKDDWVMASATASKGQTADVEKLRGLYLAQYTDHWIRFMRATRVQPFRTRADAAAALAELGAVNSPLERSVRAVVENTKIDTATSWWFTRWFRKAKGPAADVEARFAPLAAFVSSKEGKNGASPLSQYQLALQQLGDAIARTPDESWEEVAKATLAGKDGLNFKTADADVSRALDGFKSSSVADAATLLKQPIENVRGLLRGNLDEQIAGGWNELLPQARSLEAAFPFTPTGQKVSVRQIEEFLNPVDGRFTLYFKDKLASQFEDSGGQWKPKEPGRYSDEFVAYLNGIRRIRDALFPQNSQTVKVTGDVVVQKTPGADVTLEVEGTRADTRTGPSARFTWPAAQGASGARIQAFPTDGGAPADLTFPGEWGLYDMLVRGGAQKAPTGGYQLSWKVGTTSVRATLTPSTNGADPFDLSLFTIRAPQGVGRQQ